MSPQWILIAVLILGVYFFFIKNKPLSNSKKTQKSDKKKPDSDEMVECKNCGTYTSLDEALLRDGDYFCSNECLNA